jgi:hypothetical protein
VSAVLGVWLPGQDLGTVAQIASLFIRRDLIATCAQPSPPIAKTLSTTLQFVDLRRSLVSYSSLVSVPRSFQLPTISVRQREVQLNIRQTSEATPHCHVAWWRILLVREVAS